MSVTITQRAALAVVLAGAALQPAAAGGHGGGGPMVRPGGFHGGWGGLHGAGGGFHPGFGGGLRPGGPRTLPPIAGVIHERAGGRPYASAYGHTGTAARFGGYGGFGRGGYPAFGHTATALPPYGVSRPFAAGYGHLGTSLRYGRAGREGFRRFGGLGEGRRRLIGGRFVGGYGYGGGLGYGGGYGYGGGLGYGLSGGVGVSGGPETYGTAGSYGGAGTTATQSVYGDGGSAYVSERPLAARFAEPPLAPSPYAPYSPDDQYAYAASEDVGAGPRVLHVHGAAGGCACGSRPEPVFYRYGIGTAY